MLQSKRGDSSWIQTYTGGLFWVLDPHPDDVRIEDIAHALAMKCRYGGHCKQFYSVAQHSYLLADQLAKSGITDNRVLLTGLLHDAAEAYTADIPRPVKQLIPEFKEVEVRVERVIAEKFNLIYPFPQGIKLFDTRMLETERRDLMEVPERPWSCSNVEPFEDEINAKDWDLAKMEFLKRFREFNGLGA